MKTYTTETTATMDGLTVYLNTLKGSGCSMEMLGAAKRQVDAMLTHHNKVLTIYLGVHVSTYTPDNAVMSQYVRSVRKMLTTKPSSRAASCRPAFRRVGFAWFREMDRARKQHYHMAIMLDGNVVRAPQRIFDSVLKPAAERLGATAWLYERACRLDRQDKDAYLACLYRLSYGAKEHSKYGRKATANDYSTSRIQPSPSTSWTGFKNEASKSCT
ncbi:YagK/YfjJ domain-containing protein [Modicisalibacter luteus]|uniref:Inovirus-type Gp2 protein n=1 Tax=Modicisalibacter luteus TaxID=453962 RepID=A0ABV7LYY7_9GAMM|nr:inovirus-type Gp2 protein [Halomonas lutea]GHB00952.1 hypothetical protein GCM10007159_23340 [Halomonas lutea]